MHSNILSKRSFEMSFRISCRPVKQKYYEEEADMNKLAYFKFLLYSGITPFLHLENLADL